MEPTIESLKAALKSLGESSEAVALSLETLKIKGKRRKHAYCPIANYLKSLGCNGHSVTGGMIYPYASDSDNANYSFRPNDVVNDFIHDFDHGKYGFLIED